METLYRSVCGLDVHKKTVVACVRRLGERDRVWKEVRTFATMTHNLHALVAWLRQEGVTHVAMEGGVFQVVEKRLASPPATFVIL